MAFTTGEKYRSRHLGMIPRLTAGFEMGIRSFINSLFNEPGASPAIAAAFLLLPRGNFKKPAFARQ